MTELDYIKVKINNLRVADFDISELMDLLKNVETLLYPTPAEKKTRDIISYEIQHGSVINLFGTSTGQVVKTNALFGEVAKKNSIEVLDTNRAMAIQSIQEWAIEKKYDIILTTSLENTFTLLVNSETNFIYPESFWYETDLYIYGIITYLGGKAKPGFHLYTSNYGTLTIRTTESVLAGLKGNYVYKEVGTHVKTKQNIQTGEIDTKNITLLDFMDYDRDYDSEYLSNLLKNSSRAWDDVEDTDEWLAEIRGY